MATEKERTEVISLTWLKKNIHVCSSSLQKREHQTKCELIYALFSWRLFFRLSDKEQVEL